MWLDDKFTKYLAMALRVLDESRQALRGLDFQQVVTYTEPKEKIIVLKNESSEAIKGSLQLISMNREYKADIRVNETNFALDPEQVYS